MRSVVSYLADTVVVKDAQSLTKVRGVVPVISSHCAGVVPPENNKRSNQLVTVETRQLVVEGNAEEAPEIVLLEIHFNVFWKFETSFYTVIAK